MATRTGLVDLSTGEIIEEGFLGYVKPKTRHPFGRRWFAMSQEGISIMKDCKRAEDFRVLFQLMEILDYNNAILAPVKDVAAGLGIHTQHASAAMRRLVERGVLIEAGKIGANKMYTLSPALAWKGSGSQHPTKQMAGKDFVGKAKP